MHIQSMWQINMTSTFSLCEINMRCKYVIKETKEAHVDYMLMAQYTKSVIAQESDTHILKKMKANSYN